MATKLIRLTDGIIVEVTVPENQAQQISGGLADRVDSSFSCLQDAVLKTCAPILGVWENLKSYTPLKEVEVEFGLSFEGEGNLFVTKSKIGANISIKIVLASKGEQTP